MAEQVSVGKYDYRTVGGELHRRPTNCEGLSLWESAWLVLNKKEPWETPPVIPPEVVSHFRQAQDHNAVD